MKHTIEAEWEGLRNALVLAGMSTATVSRAISFHEYCEPGHDIAELDRQWAVDQFRHPFAVAHRMSRNLLRGVGEMTSAATQMVAFSPPLLVSPAPLARSAVEHSSRVWYLSQDHHKEPEQRLARFERLLSESLHNRNARGKLRNDVASDRKDDLDAWIKEKGQTLRKIRVPKISRLTEEYIAAIGLANPVADTYKNLSNVAHGNLVEIDAIAETAHKVHHKGGIDYNRLNTYGRTLFTVKCAHSAACYAHSLSAQPERMTSELIPASDIALNAPISYQLNSARGIIEVAEVHYHQLCEMLGMRVLKVAERTNF